MDFARRMSVVSRVAVGTIGFAFAALGAWSVVLAIAGGTDTAPGTLMSVGVFFATLGCGVVYLVARRPRA
jgi:hypothetical protein